jgi:hypothetical protein
MSSRDSPPLSLEVRKRGAERWCAATLVALTVLAVVQTSMQAPLTGVSLTLVGGAVLGYGMWRAQWFGSRRLVRIAWLPDGRWQLVDASGVVVEASLRGDSRVGSHYAWLRWDADIVRSMLLFRGDLTEADLRRLIVRLRIDGLGAPSSPSDHADKGSDL